MIPAGVDEEFVKHLVQGGELLGAGRVIEAKDYLERAYELQPKNERGRNLLGLTYFKLGLFDRAAEIYEALVDDNPVDPTLRVNLGLVYLKTQALQSAVREFETAVDLAPDYKKAHNYLGLALAQAGQYVEARAHFIEAGSEAMAEKMDLALSGGTSGQPRPSPSPPPPPKEPALAQELADIPESDVEVIEQLPPPVMEEETRPALAAEHHPEWGNESPPPEAIREESAWSLHFGDESFAEPAPSAPVVVESGGVVTVVPPDDAPWQAPSWESEALRNEQAAHEHAAHEQAAHEQAAHEQAAHEQAAHEQAAAPMPIPLVTLAPPVRRDTQPQFALAGMAVEDGAGAAEAAGESNMPTAWDDASSSDGGTMHYGEEEFRFDDIPPSGDESSGPALMRPSEMEGIGAVAAAAAEAASEFEESAPAYEEREPDGEGEGELGPQGEREEAGGATVIPFEVGKPQVQAGVAVAVEVDVGVGPRAGAGASAGSGRLLAQLAPSSEVLKGPLAAPFEVREEGAAITVAGELLTRVEGLLMLTGAVKLEPETRRYRGRGTNQPFGDGATRVMRATGQGVLVVRAPEGRRFTEVDLGDEGAYFREEVLYAFEESLTFENWRLNSEEMAELDLVHLWGSGKVLLRLDGALRAHQVRVGEPATVVLERLVGWFGNVTPRMAPLAVEESGKVVKGGVELSGEGFVLFTAPMR